MGVLRVAENSSISRRIAERLTLLDTLIHVNAIPVGHFERATAKSSALIPAKQAPLLDEIYKCAREERRARQANGGELGSIDLP